ncbi:MAG: GyrI-like domain-containing protein [Bacteroidetes bacterium]|nr:GyrI-like domain-containing protein [Bacteroidota bacterium]
MKALKIVIIIFVVILGIILIPPLFMPSEMYVEKTHVMKAQPEVIWDQIICLEKWEAWDVWHQDSNIVGHYEGPACGVGAKNVWTYTNMDNGGSQAIVEAREFEYIKTLLDFQEMGTADAEFFLEETEEGTKVTWNIRSDSPYPIGRWINTLLIKPNVSEAYEKGLQNLDELTKDMKPQPKYETGEVQLTEVKSMDALAIRAETSMEGLADAMGGAFGQLMQFIQTSGQEVAGYPFAIWYQWEGETFVIDNCIPVKKAIRANDPIRNIKTYSGKVVTAKHTGNYESTQYSWGVLEEYVKNNNLKTAGNPWEVYITDPMTEPDESKWITMLYWPVK